MPFSTRQQKLDKLCQRYKILRPRPTKYCPLALTPMDSGNSRPHLMLCITMRAMRLNNTENGSAVQVGNEIRSLRSTMSMEMRL